MSSSEPDRPKIVRPAWRVRLGRWRPWLWPVIALLLVAVAGVTLWSNLREDTWAYYTDGEGIRASVEGDKTRPVLWQDPEPHHFDEEKDKPTANAPDGHLEATFSPDETMMMLTRWDETRTNADLYLSRWDGRRWSTPQPMSSLNTPANERGPAWSQDGAYLYFCSDRSGGQGGYDLYVARWNGQEWTGVEVLPASVNTSANEFGPAASPDGKQLFFSSDGAGSEDILVSAITSGKDDEKAPKLAPVPKFAAAEPVNNLNSKAADVQAALTSRGDHVFLASDREGRKEGFKLYLSRVVDGKTSKPEEVDVYVQEGDATDPAVRMEGFGLLFSSNQDVGSGEDGYRLYRTTTREVIAYRDLTRWEQFKELIGNIIWWILLAILAAIALLYIFESWESITSLFHKCLAGSVTVHLIALLLAMLWLIVQQIEEEDSPSEDVSIALDALSQEELAMESVPEETVLTDTTTNLESEKVESDFGAPGFEPQKEAQAVPEAARTTKEPLPVETQPTVSTPTERPLTPPAESSVLSNLTETVLPEVETPQMEEREPSENQPVADTSNEVFEPTTPMRETLQTEPSTVADAAVESEANPTEVTDAEPREPLAETAQVPVVEPLTAESTEAPSTPSERPELESEMLTSLPAAQFVDPSEALLEEPNSANPNEASADPAQEAFDPGQAMAKLATTQGESGTVADSAVADSADAGEVASSEPAGGTPALDGSPSEALQSEPIDLVPPTEPGSGPPSDLPALSMNDLDAPTLEEPAEAPGGAMADPAADVFTPVGAASNLTTSPSDSQSVEDSAVTAAAEAAAVASAKKTATPAVEARPSKASSTTPTEDVPPSDLGPPSLNDLPALALNDPGAPLMEEPGKQAGGAPADPSADQFKPGGAVAKLNTSQATGAAVADAAKTDASDPAAMASGARTTDAVDIKTKPAAAAASATGNPTTGLATIALTQLPESSLTDPGAPLLEEPGQEGGVADPSADQFKPATSGASLATSQADGSPVSGGAVASQSDAKAVGGAARDTDANAPVSGRVSESDSNPEPGGGMIAPQLTALDGLVGELLPVALEAPGEAMKPDDMAKIIQKQRGKPGIDTIKQMGGSDGTEKSISAAIRWLVDSQEEDGHWDTLKHGAKHQYDTGGAGLALLCFYGWGERHDKPGKYQDNIQRALDWLVAQQDAQGYLGGRTNMMYSHAIASIALCEAYGLTKDVRLKEPAQRAIAYTLAAQSKTLGGWRYAPGNDSDTSITGWQFMALHSARMAGLEVPEEHFERVRGFLRRTGGGKHGGLYAYQPGNKASNAMVATGMFCRQLDLVPPTDPMMQESARHLKLHPMETSRPDLYYVYYATLALYQHQGPIWTAWNEQLKVNLPLIQKTVGEKAGSWDPSANITVEGGRVVSTALATLSLEVYYRLLPMYGFRNENAAPDAKKRGE